MVTQGAVVASRESASRRPVVPGLVGADAAMASRIASRGNSPDTVCGVNDAVCAGMLTDKYELTMLAAALRDGSADRRTTFELFARRLPDGRRYGVIGGTGRLLEALPQFRFDEEACQSVEQFLDPDTLGY